MIFPPDFFSYKPKIKLYFFMRFLFKFHQNIFILSAGSDYLFFASFSILGIIFFFFIFYKHDKILRQKKPLKYYLPPLP
jgi:hypothetical protein